MIKANTAARDVSNEKEELDAKCRRYQRYSDRKRAEIAKIAIDFGTTTTIGHYTSLYPTRAFVIGILSVGMGAISRIFDF